MKGIFVNPDTARIRAGWRIALFLIIFIALSVITMFAVRTILGSLPKTSNIQFGIVAFASTVAVWLSGKYFDKRSFPSFGLKFDRFAFLDVLSGVVNSALVMTGMFFLLLSLGLIEFQGFTWWNDPSTLARDMAWTSMITVLLTLTAVAWWEELVFRGYLLQNLAEGLNLWWAILINSIVFGFIHHMNPNATLLSSIIIVIITPQLIYAYLKTGQLWLPIGLHLGWNFFQASIYGFAASGQQDASLIEQVPTGPDWLSGGAFGAEGSVLLIPFLFASIFLIHFWVKKTRHPDQQLLDVAVHSE